MSRERDKGHNCLKAKQTKVDIKGAKRIGRQAKKARAFRRKIDNEQ